MRFVPDRAGFAELARHGRLAFVYREVVADADTPVSAYAKLGRGPYSFLLESVVGGEKWAAYSFVGVKPRAVIRRARRDGRDPASPRTAASQCAERVTTRDPLRFVDDSWRAGARGAARPAALLRRRRRLAGLRRRARFERLPAQARRAGPARVCFALTDTVVIFDNLRGTMKVVAAVDVGDDGAAIRAAPTTAPATASTPSSTGWPAPRRRCARSTSGSRGLAPAAEADRHARQTYEAGVRRIQEYIRAGDAFQVVLLAALRGAARRRRPVRRLSRAAGHQSVAVHVPPGVPRGAWSPARRPRCWCAWKAARVEVRPIAGTRRRGATAEEDAALGGRAARRPEGARRARDADRSRAQRRRPRCGAGTCGVDRAAWSSSATRTSCTWSRTSRDSCAEGKTAVDVVRAAFPAGTLSGAPKIRAMEIIEELEPPGAASTAARSATCPTRATWTSRSRSARW